MALGYGRVRTDGSPDAVHGGLRRRITRKDLKGVSDAAWCLVPNEVSSARNYRQGRGR